ncbi:MAG: hypothetical protein C0392_01420 [Syntrophus sp. (in: bacteria)]|nr:hypothetical protein [Syntrophus sp. (in: bacteria)]
MSVSVRYDIHYDANREHSIMIVGFIIKVLQARSFHYVKYKERGFACQEPCFANYTRYPEQVQCVDRSKKFLLEKRSRYKDM